MGGGYLVVFVGGGLGAAIRHGVNRASLAYLGPTFSTLSLDAALMWQRSDYAALGTYVVASVARSIGALFVGMAAVRALA